MSLKSGKSAKKIEPVSFPFGPDELLQRGLAELGFPAADGVVGGDFPLRVRGITSIIGLVNRYVAELELFNSVFDLVGADTRSDLIVRHILDSLAPWREIATLLSARQSPALADVGSGAGFPGIPLAIVFPELSVTLIERMSKRCAFLENCKAVLGLSNVKVLNSEVEKAPAGAYDAVVFRAFRPLDKTMVASLLALTRPGGRLAAWKARKDRIIEEMGAIEKEVDGWELIPVTVPFLGHEERHLVLTASAKSPSQPS